MVQRNLPGASLRDDAEILQMPAPEFGWVASIFMFVHACPQGQSKRPAKLFEEFDDPGSQTFSCAVAAFLEQRRARLMPNRCLRASGLRKLVAMCVQFRPEHVGYRTRRILRTGEALKAQSEP